MDNTEVDVKFDNNYPKFTYEILSDEAPLIGKWVFTVDIIDGIIILYYSGISDLNGTISKVKRKQMKLKLSRDFSAGDLAVTLVLKFANQQLYGR
jgi:hypothetical protein